MLRRTICVILTVVLVCLVFGAIAEEAAPSYDYMKNMTVDELNALAGQIGIELESRGIYASDSIPEGSYVVGRDIKAGNYEFFSYGKGTNAFGAAVDGWIVIKKDYDKATSDYASYDQHFFNERDYGQPFYVTLADGDMFSISYAKLYVRASQAKSWQ